MKTPILLLLILILFSFAAASEAATRHTVKKGETLTSISKKYHVELKDLKQANKSVKNLKAGDKLLIPSKKQIATKEIKSETSSSTASKKQQKSSVIVLAEDAGSLSPALYHIVKKGDTLTSISKKYSVTIADVKKLNGLKKSAKIKGGQKLLVRAESTNVHTMKKDDSTQNIDSRYNPGPEEVKPETSSKTASIRQQKNVAAAKGSDSLSPALYHTVKKGDTLTSISKKYSVTIADVKKLNGLKKSAKIKRGQKLLVRAEETNIHIVKKEDSIQSIASRYNVDPEELMEINEVTSETLKVGQKLYLSQDQSATAKVADIEILKKTMEEEIKTESDSDEFKAKPLQDKIIAFAKKLLNIPYKFGGNSILGIDCSAYVKKVYGYMGIDLPRTAREQFNKGEAIEKEELSIGDLVFFRTYASFPSHVGIYLGNNLFIHASEKGKKVRVDNLNAPYFVKRFIGAKRLLIDDEPTSTDPQILSATE